MSGKRLPLSSNPNAANSPYRSAATAASSKQKRSYATLLREESYGQPPPAKKLMLESNQLLKTNLRLQHSHTVAENKDFLRNINASQSSFERCNPAGKEKTGQQQITRAVKVPGGDSESVQRWRKHYRRNFPRFVFYFESVPEDVRIRFTKAVVSLGAKEEKFFSNAVTHVVTTRTIPTDPDDVSTSQELVNGSCPQANAPQTINPSLLENSRSDLLAKTRGSFDVPSRRLACNNDQDTKRHQVRSTDVLLRARDLGMKIWALEKLQRMITTMFHSEIDSLYEETGGDLLHCLAVYRGQLPDLGQLLKNEKINGPSDRDPTVASKDLNIFKGPFIYIRDIDEKLKPIMVREYNKVSEKVDGDWPQFRSVANGRCPFVDDHDYNKREAEKEKGARYLQKQQNLERNFAAKTLVAATEVSKIQPPKAMNDNRTLSDLKSLNRVVGDAPKNQNKPSQLGQLEFEYSSRGAQNAFISRAGAGRMFGGEPVASGLQASNITSAIRSQIISSTAAQPGAKAGTSKEIHCLQRKVLEKNSGGHGSYGFTSSHRMTDMSYNAREDATARTTRRKEHEKLKHIEEDPELAEQDSMTHNEKSRKAKTGEVHICKKRDLKPGFCENCQEKFEDFEEHVLDRKHRKFAEDFGNWKDLDNLLATLERPLREEYL